MNIIGNILWLLLGGLIIFMMYLLGSVILIITIIGIPFGIQTLKLSVLALWPFGKEINDTSRSSGCLYILMNILWLFVAGLEIAVLHCVFGILLAITIIGIPFAKQHFKLALLALMPFGKTIN